MKNKAIDYYVSTFPQLTLGVGEGIMESEAYKDIVLRGNIPDVLELPFEYESKAEIIHVDTPLGRKDVLYLPERELFEYFYRVLGNRCENVEIPKTTGAVFIQGLNNWRKIEKHEEEFLKDNPDGNWDEEFERFTSIRENYRDSVLLISKGCYSNVEADEVGFEKDKWLLISKKIRIYHELTHYISRTLYPEHKEAIRDEVIADCIGCIYATGKYDRKLVLRVLGIKDGKYIEGSRLENYTDDKENAVNYVIEFTKKLEEFISDRKEEPFEILIDIENEYIR